jgi:pilus assembly protein Flp/PilA
MFKEFRAKVRQAAKSESGATAIEYGLIAAGIAVVIIGAVEALGEGLQATFGKVVIALQSLGN